MKNDNILIFPKGKRGAPPQSLNEILSSVEDVREEHIQILTNEIAEMILYRLHEEGIDISAPQNIVQVAYMSECLKATVLRAMNKKHPIHSAAEDFFKNKSE